MFIKLIKWLQVVAEQKMVDGVDVTPPLTFSLTKPREDVT